MNIKTANALYDEGIFSEMYKAGFVTNKFFTYREIYLWVNAQIQVRGITKNEAVLEAEIKFSKDERTIWRALNSFTTTDTVVSPSDKNKITTFEYAKQHNFQTAKNFNY